MNTNAKERRPRTFVNPSRLLVGLLFIAYGFSAYDKMTGLFNLRVDILKLWPLFVVAAGISVLPDSRTFFRTLKWLTFFSAVSVAAFLVVTDTQKGYDNKELASVEEIKVSPHVEKLEIHAEFGPGKVRISRNKADKVLKVVASKSGFFGKIQSKIHGRTQVVTVARTDDIDLTIKPVNARVLLPGGISVRLNVKAGATSILIDLKELESEYINLECGASSVEIFLGNELENQIVNISGGASNFVLTVPEEAYVAINTKNSFTSLDLPESFEKQDNGTFRNGSSSDPSKITVNVDAGASVFTVKTY